MLNFLVYHFIVIYPPYSLCGLVNSWSHKKVTFYSYFIDPGEVAVCFGDEGTWCPLYTHDIDGQIHQEYSDGEETVSSLSSDDDLVQNVKSLNINDTHIPSKQTIDSNTSRSSSSLASNSRTSSPFFNAISTTMNTQIQTMNEPNFYASTHWNDQQNLFWPQQLTSTESLLFSNPREN